MPRTVTERLNKDIQDLVAEIGDDLQNAAEKSGDEAAAAMRRSAKAMHRAANRLAGELRDAGEDTLEAAKAHPYATAALIASAAALIGLAVAHRNGAGD